MTAIARFESRMRVRGTVVLTGAFVVLSGFMLVVFPAMAEEAEAIERAFPDHAAALFGFEALHTIEGFVGSYMFPFIWVLMLGVYFGYIGGGLIAGDIRERRMDLTLANPVSRESVLAQKLLGLWVPIVSINLVLYIVLLGGARLLGETLDPVTLGMAHLLSIPYVLVCAAIGLLFSVVLSRPETAQMTALGAVFLLWLIDGLSEMDPNLEWIGALTPSRYFDPTAILVHESFAWGDAAILLASFVILTGLATLLFIRRDI